MLSAGSYSPETGSTLSVWKKTSWRMSANQNDGIDTPKTEVSRTSASSGRPRHRAATSPAGTPSTSASSSAAPTSSSEAGARVARSESTG